MIWFILGLCIVISILVIWVSVATTRKAYTIKHSIDPIPKDEETGSNQYESR